MARAKSKIAAEAGLYERDFCLWVEEQVRLLRAGELERLARHVLIAPPGER